MRGLGVMLLILLALFSGGCSLMLFFGALALGFQDGVGLGLLGILLLGFCVAIIQSLRNMSGDSIDKKKPPR